MWLAPAETSSTPEERPATRTKLSAHPSEQLLDTRDHSPLSRDLELHFIELPKLRKTRADAERDPVLRWARFLAARTDEELETLAMEDPMLTEAKLALERLSMDPIAREAAIKRDHELASFLDDLEVEREKGRAEGLAEGLRDAVEQTCFALGVELSTEQRDVVRSATTEELRALHRRILVGRAWPE